MDCGLDTCDPGDWEPRHQKSRRDAAKESGVTLRGIRFSDSDERPAPSAREKLGKKLGVAPKTAEEAIEEIYRLQKKK